MVLATSKQITFIDNLCEERDLSDVERGSMLGIGLAQLREGRLEKRDASFVIDDLLSRPRVTQPSDRVAVTEPGLHCNDAGEFVKVVRSKTGNLYAKVAQINPISNDEVRVDWEYTGKRGLRGLSDDTVVDADTAAAFGRLTGRCIFCGRHLETPESVSVGYGPVCAERNRLPWGDVATDVGDAHLAIVR